MIFLTSGNWSSTQFNIDGQLERDICKKHFGRKMIRSSKYILNWVLEVKQPIHPRSELRGFLGKFW